MTRSTLHEAAGELARRDRVLRGIHERLGTPPLWGRQPGFATLVHIILEQQVSIPAARTLFLRLKRHLGGMTAERVAATSVVALQRFGLTRQKAGYCHGLALRIVDGQLDLGVAARAPDELGRRELLAVPGLGPWSVDIYYLMALRRPDVWPTGDLALAVAMRDLEGMSRLPTRDEQAHVARRWSPWRSVAARLLWAHYLEARGRYLPERRPARSLAGRQSSAAPAGVAPPEPEVAAAVKP